MQQTTIRQRIECAGIGLHSGKTVRLGLRPAAENTGIVFHAHTPSGIVDLAPSPHSVVSTGLATTLGLPGRTDARAAARVATVEHLLAAIRALNIDNIHIDAESEIPIMDGSAAAFVMLLNDAGLRRQRAGRSIVRVTRPLKFGHDGKTIQVRPYDGFFVDCTIDFPHPLIGVQRKAMEITPNSFTAIARARTFGFLREVEAMRAGKLALGGSLDNAVVLDECGVVNQDGLRFADEFVRHKILDFVGDMAMLGRPLYGHFTIARSGHALNNEFLRVLADNASIYLETVTATPERESVPLPEAAPVMAAMEPEAA